MFGAKDGREFWIVISFAVSSLSGWMGVSPLNGPCFGQVSWESRTSANLLPGSREGGQPASGGGAVLEGWRSARESSPENAQGGAGHDSSPGSSSGSSFSNSGAVRPDIPGVSEAGSSPSGVKSSPGTAGVTGGSTFAFGAGQGSASETTPPSRNVSSHSSTGNLATSTQTSSPAIVGTQGASKQGEWVPAGSSPTATGVSGGNSGAVASLPAVHGQMWREYDIRPYTAQVRSTKRPEAAVVEWILRETGYEVWHGEVLAILNATTDRVVVYHTPEIQNVVAEVIQRFTASGGEPISLGVRLIVVSHPGWQASWLHALTPVRVQSGGIRAWVLHREDVSLLLADLRRRPDYREHHVPQVMVANGQTAVVSATKAQPYVRAISWRPEVWPGFSPETAFLDEGFVLELSPLLAVDERQIDLAMKLEIQQVERLVPLPLELASANGQPSRPRLEIPQRVQVLLHERFRWPLDQALLVDLGMGPVPIPVDSSRFSSWRWPFASSAPRGNVLLLIEVRPSGQATTASKASSTTSSGINRLGY
jgi:hypothetical protein